MRPNIKVPFLNQKRFLGNLVRGPLTKEVNKNMEYALDFFTKRAHTYQDMKQQCESLRIFVYFGLVAFLSIDLCINPLKSSYWEKYTIPNICKRFICSFKNKSDSIFRHNDIQVYEQYMQLLKK